MKNSAINIDPPPLWTRVLSALFTLLCCALSGLAVIAAHLYQ